MAKKQNIMPVYFDIHSLVRVWAPDLPIDIAGDLKEWLNLFISESVPDEIRADIIVSRLQEDNTFEWTNNHIDLEYGFKIEEHEGAAAVIFAYRTKPDIVAVMSDVIKIYYSNRQGVSGRLYEVLSFCIQVVCYRGNAMLFHGAVAEKHGQGVLLTGASGTKKTMLLLNMLMDEWNFISDDKFILYQGGALMLDSTISLRDYYFDCIRSLKNYLPDADNFRKRESLKRVRVDFIFKHTPSYLLPLVKRLYNPFTTESISADVLIPGCKIIRSSKIHKVVLLHTGPHFSIERSTKKDVIEELLAIHRLTDHDTMPINCLLYLHNPKYYFSIREIIETNFSEQDFIRLTLPVRCDPELVYKEVEPFLRQA
jgi:hypothetical protein